MNEFQAKEHNTGIKSWGWFIGLAFGGLVATTALTYLTKALLKLFS